MSGRGKGGYGLGKGGAKRHRKVLRDNIQGITKPAIRRLARRGGVKRISNLVYEETRSVLKVFMENVLRDTVTYAEHARRKTVACNDVVFALKRQGRTIYGAGEQHRPDPALPKRSPNKGKHPAEWRNGTTGHRSLWKYLGRDRRNRKKKLWRKRRAGEAADAPGVEDNDYFAEEEEEEEEEEAGVMAMAGAGGEDDGSSSESVISGSDVDEESDETVHQQQRVQAQNHQLAQPQPMAQPRQQPQPQRLAQPQRQQARQQAPQQADTYESWRASVFTVTKQADGTIRVEGNGGTETLEPVEDEGVVAHYKNPHMLAKPLSDYDAYLKERSAWLVCGKLNGDREYVIPSSIVVEDAPPPLAFVVMPYMPSLVPSVTNYKLLAHVMRELDSLGLMYFDIKAEHAVALRESVALVDAAELYDNVRLLARMWSQTDIHAKEANATADHLAALRTSFIDTATVDAAQIDYVHAMFTAAEGPDNAHADQLREAISYMTIVATYVPRNFVKLAKPGVAWTVEMGDTGGVQIRYIPSTKASAETALRAIRNMHTLLTLWGLFMSGVELAMGDAFEAWYETQGYKLGTAGPVNRGMIKELRDRADTDHDILELAMNMYERTIQVAKTPKIEEASDPTAATGFR
jgi:histone H4